MEHLPLSIVIITFNEAGNIHRCIDSVRGLGSEVLVVDSGSTDGTPALAQEAGATVLNQPFLGYIEQKNFATSKAKFDWVLSLDADEALTPELSFEIRETLKNPLCKGYSMPRLTNYCGHWVRHSGWYPDRKLRLYDRRHGTWTGINPHDRYDLEPGLKSGLLQHNLLHYSYNSLSDHLRQIDRFSAIGAKALYDKGVRSSIFKILIKPIARFLRAYVVHSGYRDGWTGLVIAANSAHAVFLKYLRLLYLHKGKTI
jgi:glycosyltransferase involved in cell wall biosynthesis